MKPPFFAKYIGQQIKFITINGTDFNPNIDYGDVVLVKSIDRNGNYLAVHEDNSTLVPFVSSDFDNNTIDTQNCEIHMKIKTSITITNKNNTSQQENKDITDFKYHNAFLKKDSCKIDDILFKYKNSSNYSTPLVPISKLKI